MSANPQPQGRPEEPLPEGAARRGPVLRPVFAPPVSEAAARWSPVFAGVLMAMGIAIVIYALGTAIGLTATVPGATGTTAVVRGAVLTAGIGWIVALFVGGYLSGRLGPYVGLRRGVLQGSLVWAIYVLVWLSIVTSGIGGALSLTGGTVLPGLAARGAAQNPSLLVHTAAGTAWWLFGALVVGWIVAIIGGALGTLGLVNAESRRAA